MSPADIDVVSGPAPGPQDKPKAPEPAKAPAEAKPAPAAQKPAPAATPAPPAPAKPAVPAAAPKVSAADIERWFVESFHGSVVAQNTQTFNHVRRAVDELKRRLSAG